jgi:hypothetical protein
MSISISKLQFLLNLILITLTLQGEKCAKYSCTDMLITPCADVKAESNSNQVRLASRCRNGKTCNIPGNPWQTLTYASKSETFSCSTESFNKRLPGEDCSSDFDCSSGVKEACNNKKCIGAALGEACQKHEECLVGLFCDNQSSKCTEQKSLKADCGNSYECVNNLLCQGGTCSVTPYSLQQGAKVDGDFLETKCVLGFVDNGQCSKLIQWDLTDPSLDNLKRCEMGEKCAYKTEGTESVITNDCQCGYNEKGYGYCPRGHDSSN